MGGSSAGSDLQRGQDKEEDSDNDDDDDDDDDETLSGHVHVERMTLSSTGGEEHEHEQDKDVDGEEGRQLFSVRQAWLFVGSGEAAQDWRRCHALGITRFLRLGGPPPPMNRIRPQLPHRADATTKTTSTETTSGSDAQEAYASLKAVQTDTATATYTVQDVMSFEIDDDDEADLLSILPTCNEFILKSKPQQQGETEQNGVKLLETSASSTMLPGESVQEVDASSNSNNNNGILVYCSAGVSRSQSVVASFLMWNEQLSLNQAMTELPQHASPNENFMKQLLLLERMGGSVDVKSKIFRAYRQNRLAKQIELYGYFNSNPITEHDLGTIEVRSASMSDHAHGECSSNMRSTVYRCRKCRRILATSANVIEHIPLRGEEKATNMRKKNSLSSSRRNVNDFADSCMECHIYVEAVSWMREELEKGELEGKLLCIHCDTRLGKYSWRGMQCACSRWVVPAFMLQRSKVDAMVQQT